jgi:hypothetical protein
MKNDPQDTQNCEHPSRGIAQLNNLPTTQKAGTLYNKKYDYPLAHSTTLLYKPRYNQDLQPARFSALFITYQTFHSACSLSHRLFR